MKKLAPGNLNILSKKPCAQNTIFESWNFMCWRLLLFKLYLVTLKIFLPLKLSVFSVDHSNKAAAIRYNKVFR